MELTDLHFLKPSSMYIYLARLLSFCRKKCLNICFTRRPHDASEMIPKTVQTYQRPTIQKMHTVRLFILSQNWTESYNKTPAFTNSVLYTCL